MKLDVLRSTQEGLSLEARFCKSRHKQIGSNDGVKVISNSLNVNNV